MTNRSLPLGMVPAADVPKTILANVVVHAPERSADHARVVRYTEPTHPEWERVGIEVEGTSLHGVVAKAPEEIADAIRRMGDALKRYGTVTGKAATEEGQLVFGG